MLRSKRFSFIFIHIPKTAGSSIRQALLPYADNQLAKVISTPFRKLAFPIDFGPEPLHAHATAQQIMNVIGSSFHEYFTFAFVRNPFEYVASTYAQILKDKRHPRHHIVKYYEDLNEFVLLDVASFHHLPQYDFIFSDQGIRLLNFIGKYEEIQSDFLYVCNRIGVPFNLPHLNSSMGLVPPRSYSEDAKDVIRKVYQQDFHQFDFSSEYN